MMIRIFKLERSKLITVGENVAENVVLPENAVHVAHLDTVVMPMVGDHVRDHFLHR
jgi:hypothetical protein